MIPGLMLKVQRRAGDGLGSEFHGDVGGADFCHSLNDHIAGEFGAVAFAAEMAQIEVTQFGGHDFLRGIGGIGVGEMTVAAGDALLETPRAAGILQEFQVVVGLQDEDVGGANAFQRQLGGMAQISQKADVAARRVQEKTDGIRGVVRDAEGVNDDVADFKAAAGGEDSTIKLGLELPFDAVLGGTVAVDGNLQLGAEGGESVDMVGVLVGDEDAREAFRRAANGGQALADLTQAEPGIDENAGFGRLQVGTITAGAAAKNRELNGHSITVVGGVRRGNIFPEGEGFGAGTSAGVRWLICCCKGRLSTVGCGNLAGRFQLKAKITPNSCLSY
ncbi:MAG: hypothetical protein JWR69_438 [Pedosphaera sp.]|nr:hypothetical protein [Pedosphaera sp.]